MAQPQQQNLQQTDNYYDPTAGYENNATVTETPDHPGTDDAVGKPSADAAGVSSTDALGAAGVSSTDAVEAAGVSSTGYVPGDYDAEFPVTAVPDGTHAQEAGEPGTEIPPEAGNANPEIDPETGEYPKDKDDVSVDAASEGKTPAPGQPPVEGDEVKPPDTEAKEGSGNKQKSKSQNYSNKHYGRRGESSRRKSGSGDYYKSSYYNYTSKPSTNPYGQQQQPAQGPCQIGVIPMRSAAFQAPRIPLPKLCKNLLPNEADEGQEDEDGVAFQFKPQTHCRTEVTFTIEPKPQPPWLTMLNCGFKPMVNCSAPPCYLSPSGNPGMDYMGGNQTVVNRTFGTQVQYCGMANFPTLQQIQNSFPGGKIIDTSRKDRKGKSISSSESSSESSSGSSSSSGSESEEERYPHHHHGAPHKHYHQPPVHHHQNAHHAHDAHKHQHKVQPQRRRSTHHLPAVNLPKKSVYAERKSRHTMRSSTVHDHKNRRSRHSHHHTESSASSSGTGTQYSRSSDWHM